MISRNGIFALVAAGTSVLLHAAVLTTFRRIHVGGPGAPQGRFEEMTVVFDPAPDRAPDESEFPIGEIGAKGYASHRADGLQEAVSRQAEVDQAALSRDPVGTSPPQETPGENAGAGGARASSDGGPLPPVLPTLRPMLDRLPLAALVPIPPTPPEDGPRAVVPTPTPPAVAVAVTPPPVGVAVTPPPVAAAPAAPGSAGRGGADPAPMSDSESDAFSVLGSAEFRDGRLSVKAGRKVRSRRPKIGLAGQLDLYQRMHAQVTLKVSTDATGKVTDVDVVRSSGSNEIDQPCRVAMYDWWFEPKKDAAGKPVADVFRFTIGFH
jgi:TonB family protein